MLKEIGIGVLSVALAVTTIGTVSYYNQVAGGNTDNARLNQQTERRISAVKADTRNLTQAQVTNNMMKDGVNLNDAKKDASDRINNAFKIAYGDMQKKDFDKDKAEFIKQLGPSFGKYLTDLTQSDEGYVYGYSIDQMKIGFGAYDASTKTIPIMVTVTYKGTDKSTTNSNDYWTVTYNVKNKSFSNPKGQLVVPPATNNVNTDQFVAK